MKIFEIINESAQSASDIELAEVVLATGWDYEKLGEFVSYKKLESLLAKLSSIVAGGAVGQELEEAALEIQIAADIYSNASGFNNLVNDSGATKLKATLNKISKDANELFIRLKK